MKRKHFGVLVTCTVFLSVVESAAAQAVPVLTKAFGAPTILLTQTTSLTLSVTNPNAAPLSGVVISDTLPAGLVIANPDGFNGTGPCIAGINGISAGSGSFSYALAPMPASSTCTFTVNVTGTTTGVKNNTATVASAAGPGTPATASLTVVAPNPPVLTKTFGAPTILLTQSTSLTLSVTNPDTIDLAGVVISDTLPAGLVIANPDGFNGTGPCVAGINGISAGSGQFTYSLAPMPAGATCTFTVNVTGTTSGIKNNTATVTATLSGPGTPASASLTVVTPSPPVLTKTFGAPTILLTQNTSLTLSVTNPDTIALAGVVISDTLPAGLVIANPDGFNGTGPCVAGINGISAGSGQFTYSLAPMPAGATCTFTVNVTGTTTGVKNNTATVTATLSGPGTPATASVTVVTPNPPVLTKTFGAPTILLNHSTSLTLSVTNPDTIDLAGVVISDTLPAGLVIANPDGFNGTGPCVAGINGISAGSGQFTYSLAPMPAGATCTFTVNVTGTSLGVKNNSATVTATLSGPGLLATASVTVLEGVPPTLTKSFADTVISFNPTTNLVFTINNPNAAVTLHDIAFTDTLPSGLLVSTPNGLTNTCGGPISAIPGGSIISASGITLAPSASCTITVSVTGITDGTQINTTGPISSSNGGTGTSATSTVTVQEYILYLWYFS